MAVFHGRYGGDLRVMVVIMRYGVDLVTLRCWSSSHNGSRQSMTKEYIIKKQVYQTTVNNVYRMEDPEHPKNVLEITTVTNIQGRTST